MKVKHRKVKPWMLACGKQDEVSLITTHEESILHSTFKRTSDTIETHRIMKAGSGMSKSIFSPVETKILRLIRSNPEAVGRAMVALYKRQTADEQRAGTTVHSNGRGFNAADASKGTYYAKWVLSGKQLNGQFLTHAQDMARKYLGQLVEIAEERKANWEAREHAKFN